MVRFAKCCNPVPGDDILGYITKGRGVQFIEKTVEILNNLIKEDPQKVVDVSWGTSNGVAYMAEIQVKTEDKIRYTFWCYEYYYGYKITT